nr:uncharacterized protein [Tanacetum cinerariifolium]
MPLLAPVTRATFMMRCKKLIGGRVVHVLFKEKVEVGGLLEAQRPGNLGNVPVGEAQQRLGLAHEPRGQQAADRAALHGLHLAVEVVGMQGQLAGEVAHGFQPQCVVRRLNRELRFQQPDKRAGHHLGGAAGPAEGLGGRQALRREEQLQQALLAGLVGREVEGLVAAVLLGQEGLRKHAARARRPAGRGPVAEGHLRAGEQQRVAADGLLAVLKLQGVSAVQQRYRIVGPPAESGGQPLLPGRRAERPALAAAGKATEKRNSRRAEKSDQGPHVPGQRVGFRGLPGAHHRHPPARAARAVFWAGRRAPGRRSSAPGSAAGHRAGCTGRIYSGRNNRISSRRCRTPAGRAHREKTRRRAFFPPQKEARGSRRGTVRCAWAMREGSGFSALSTRLTSNCLAGRGRHLVRLASKSHAAWLAGCQADRFHHRQPARQKAGRQALAANGCEVCVGWAASGSITCRCEPGPAFAVVVTSEGSDSKQFPIIGKAGSAAVLYDAAENILVAKAANFLAEDIDKVSGQKPQVLTGGRGLPATVILVGTVGMRGDGDAGMGEGTAVGLLQTIIKDQRSILAEVTGKPAAQTPQVWAIYKEVQDYYDKGMRVDDDITVLFSDDNWGNIKYLPKQDLNRKGGYGMYYHFDYVGAPVSYRWQNVTQLERVWEQMNITYAHGVKNLWIVNVGDIKPMELPLSFFLDYAWDPTSIQAKDLPAYYAALVPGRAAPPFRCCWAAGCWGFRSAPAWPLPHDIQVVHAPVYGDEIPRLDKKKPVRQVGVVLDFPEVNGAAFALRVLVRIVGDGQHAARIVENNTFGQHALKRVVAYGGNNAGLRIELQQGIGGVRGKQGVVCRAVAFFQVGRGNKLPIGADGQALRSAPGGGAGNQPVHGRTIGLRRVGVANGIHAAAGVGRRAAGTGIASADEHEAAIGRKTRDKGAAVNRELVAPVFYGHRRRLANPQEGKLARGLVHQRQGVFFRVESRVVQHVAVFPARYSRQGRRRKLAVGKAVEGQGGLLGCARRLQRNGHQGAGGVDGHGERNAGGIDLLHYFGRSGHYIDHREQAAGL